MFIVNRVKVAIAVGFGKVFLLLDYFYKTAWN
jgi:hypothetical protein